MSTKNKHINEEPELPKKIQDIIGKSGIEWKESKEDIWMKMEAKLEQPKAKKIRLNVYPQLMQYAAAASVVLLIGFSATAALYTTKITTGISQQKEIRLPDNSRVNLHANSAISYKPLLWHFSHSTKLEGEAYFKVEKGNEFEVVSAKATTVVVGTEFTVTARENKYSVDCKSGKVKIIEATHTNEVIISAGEKAELKSNKQFKISSYVKNIDLKAKHDELELKSTDNENKPNQIISSPIEHKKECVVEKPQTKETPDVNTNIKEPTINAKNPTEGMKNLADEEKVDKQAIKQEKLNNQESKDEIKANGESSEKRFRNSLSKKQMDILEDKKMSKEEKKNAFMSSLSDEQRKLLKEQNNEIVKDEKGNKNTNQSKQEIKNGEQKRNGQQVKNGMGGIFKQNGKGK